MWPDKADQRLRDLAQKDPQHLVALRHIVLPAEDYDFVNPIAKAKAAPSLTVNVVGWVMKPGPIALVAMRNMAPSSAVPLALRGRRPRRAPRRQMPGRGARRRAAW